MRGETTNSALPEPSASTNTAIDRRRHPRYRFAAPISVRTSESMVIEGMTLEISESGLSAVLSSPVKIGDSVQLEPIASGTVTARVRYNVGKVYGFEFLQISEIQIEKLRDDCRRLPHYPRVNKMGI
jgi:hypothetical protein